MARPTLAARNLIKDRRGASLTTYMMLLGIIALASLVYWRALGKAASNKIGNKPGSVQTTIPGTVK